MSLQLTLTPISGSLVAESAINQTINWANTNIEGFEPGNISDGYHTFNELYEFRKAFNAALFNEWAKQDKYFVHKSTNHHNGELCFGGGWFIVVADLPTGQISNHYKIEDWDLFEIPSFEKAYFEYDGHTPADVLERLKNII